MKNDPIGATAEGMPSLTRRSILGRGALALAGGAAIAFAAPDMDARATVAHDPMLLLVNEYRAAEANAEALDFDGDEDAFDLHLLQNVDPIRERIAFAPPMVTSEAGARECIRAALNEATMCGQIEKSLLTAALVFLDGRAAR